MRWTKRWFAVVPLLLAVACMAAGEKPGEVRECSRIPMNAQGAAQCLGLQFKWNKAAALTAATQYQRQQDSLAQFKADSSWRGAAAQHKKEIALCASDPSGEAARCLSSFGWAEARATATADSLWRRDASKHRGELAACTRNRQMQAGACLQLYYKWSPQPAPAVDDSMRRPKLPR